VAPEAAGSSPVTHPIQLIRQGASLAFFAARVFLSFGALGQEFCQDLTDKSPVGILQINTFGSVEHDPGGMAGNFHDHTFGHARFPHVGVQAVPQVVEDKTTFHESAIVDAGIPTDPNEPRLD
jgi:hypothetical protein